MLIELPELTMFEKIVLNLIHQNQLKDSYFDESEPFQWMEFSEDYKMIPISAPALKAMVSEYLESLVVTAQWPVALNQAIEDATQSLEDYEKANDCEPSDQIEMFDDDEDEEFDDELDEEDRALIERIA